MPKARLWDDFISDYTQYADVLEAPRSMHTAIAILLIASVLNRAGVRIVHGALTYTLDLWLALVSESGGGRNTIIRLAHQIAKAAGLDDLTRSSHWGSPQALYQELSQCPHALYSWGELSEKLKQLNSPAFAGAKEWITDRYDETKVPDTVRYRETGRANRNTPPIEFKRAPRINILASSSEEWFFRNLESQDSMGGFIPRWMIVAPPSTKKIIPTPKSPNPALLPSLADQLRGIGGLRGDADLSLVLPDYDRWYRDTWERFQKQTHQALASAFFNRHRVHILKLAVIFEASRSTTLTVTHTAWHRAVATAAELEATIFAKLPTAMSKEGYEIGRMEDAVRNAGKDGLPASVFTRRFQHQDRRDRTNRLRTLIEAATVRAYARRTVGRSATYLVHSEVVARYRRAHPEDVETAI